MNILARLESQHAGFEFASRAFFDAQNPGGRMVRPDEVAEAIYSLLAGDANGTLLELDGSDRPIVHGTH